ncbi:adenylate kinase 1 chloroplast, putative [Ricinus communis]|uniref:adenylate kinase n=1 Tax=Ricinus communis TaxID=3988 RepID=B9RBL1_RICCO|nr:adenylate kinase 1 chloroplast, putative [Ricinus communis]|eukprot:XP_002509545.1 probable adenylate kinase 7, mitochondrial [Ricinus communis]
MAGLSRLGLVAAATPPPYLSSLRRILTSRAYGSAAAIQYDYEDYYSEAEDGYDHQDRHSRHPEPCLDSVANWGRGVQWVLIGDPGVKKHVYAEELSKLLEVPHISMGTLLRQELNPRSSLYKQIANAVNEGKLVPEEVIFGLLSKRFEEGYCRGEKGFILDGIPRTRIQAEILDQIADIDLIVNFKCTEENLVKKDLITVKNSTSSVTGAGTAWKEKFRIYAEQGKAVEDYYRKQKKLIDFQMAAAPGETWQGLLAALHLKHLGAISSSQKLAV